MLKLIISYDTYECKDGKFMSVGSVENHFWKMALEKLGLDKEINVGSQMKIIPPVLNRFRLTNNKIPHRGQRHDSS